jgi:hypothetical protein
MTMKSFQFTLLIVCLLVLSCEAVAQLPPPQNSEREVIEGVVVDQAGDPIADDVVNFNSCEPRYMKSLS